MDGKVQSPFSGAVMKNSKTVCTGDGKSTGTSSAGSSKMSY